MTRGGKRENAGRKPNEEKTVIFYKRVTPQEKKKLELYLDQIRKGGEMKKVKTALEAALLAIKTCSEVKLLDYAVYNYDKDTNTLTCDSFNTITKFNPTFTKNGEIYPFHNKID